MNISDEAKAWNRNYHGSIDTTALLLAFDAGRRSALASTPEASDDEREAAWRDCRLRLGVSGAAEHVAIARRYFFEGMDYRRSPVPADTPSDVEQAIKRLESRGFGERMDYFIGKQNGDALRLIFDAARRSPVPTDTPSEGDFPCCDDGEHVPAEIAGDLFTATLNRAQWHRVDEALAAHGRNDAVWSQIAATKTAARPTPHEDVAVEVRAFRHEVERPPESEVMVLVTRHLARSVLAALATRLADGEALS